MFLILFFFFFIFFFFNDTATTEIYTLSLHDALPIFYTARLDRGLSPPDVHDTIPGARWSEERRLNDKGDRKSTRLNSSHSQISYAVFCLKKKKKKKTIQTTTIIQNIHTKTKRKYTRT